MNKSIKPRLVGCEKAVYYHKKSFGYQNKANYANQGEDEASFNFVPTYSNY